MTDKHMDSARWRTYLDLRAKGLKPVAARNLVAAPNPEYTQEGDQGVVLVLPGSAVPRGAEVRVTWTEDYDADPSWLGRFTDEWSEDAIVANPPHTQAFRFFVPEVTAAEHRRSLSDLGYSRAVAEEVAQGYVRRDMEMARAYVALVVSVEVYKAGVLLAVESIGDVAMSVDGYTVDEVLDVVSAHGMVGEAVGQAKVTLVRLDDEAEKVTVWADGFGVWHARVTFAGGGYGPAALAEEIDRIRARARRAIRSQIKLREKVGAKWRCALVVAETALDSMNVAHSITYREKTEG